MKGFTEYEVIVPPTSGEVQDELLEALKEQRPLTLTLLGRFAIPRPEPTEVAFRVARTIHPESSEGEEDQPPVATHISGKTEEGELVYVSVFEDMDQPATATLL